MSVGFNGAGTESTTYSFYSCIPPSGFDAPTGVGTSTQITISWTEPRSNGGCPITGYAIFRNEGDGTSATTEVNLSNDSQIRNNPSLRSAVVTFFPASSVGKTFLFRVIVYTADSSSYSSGLLIKLAGLPGTPTSAPSLITSETDTTRITVQMPQVTDTGGDAIFTYNLQIDDGKGGSFVSVAGEETRSLQTYYSITNGIVRGLHYRIRYRVANSVGWSDFSPNLEALAATYPEAPPAPTLSSSTATTIVLNLFETGNDQGSPVTLYELWMNNGTDGSAFAKIQTWSSIPSTFSVTSTANSITSGKIYSFEVHAKNSIGYNILNNDSRFAAASFPAQPSTPTKVSLLSNTTHITVAWSTVADTEVPITNYRLYVSHNGGDYSLIYDGNGNTLQLQYTYTGSLIIGHQYSFKVSALNMNGEGPLSNQLDVYACTAPSIPSPPTWTSSTITSITLNWSPPASDGGCALQGWNLLTDSGTGGSVVNEVDSTLKTNPQVLTATATFDSSKTGSWIRFRIEAINAEASSISKTVQYVLAIAPTKPTYAPSEVTTETTDTQLVVLATELVSENGGSSIISYEFQVDNGNFGSYTSVQGTAQDPSLSLKATITYGIQRGLQYRVRYRGINSVGAGAWSDAVTITASTVPGKPQIPVVSSVDNTQITLTFTAVTDNGGSAVTAYELYYSDSGVSLSTFTIDTSYDGTSMTYVFSSAINAGRTYGFQIRAKNSRGYSDFSGIVYAAAGRAPSTPSAPTLDLTNSNKTYLSIKWTEGTSLDIPVLGYLLSADDRGNGEYSVVWDGSGQPNVLSFIHGPLETGETYNFKLQVLNYNGASAYSNVLSAVVCIAPSGFSSLIATSSSPTSLAIAWNQPQDNGGCPITKYVQYSDDGAGGVLAIETATIPSTTLQLTLDRTSNSGKTYRLQVEAVNANGSIKSNIISLVTATVPTAPTSSPTSIQSQTNAQQIAVQITQVTATGSSPITSYELQRDDGVGGSFYTIGGGDSSPTLATSFLIKSNIQTGVAYRFRYRARNVVGWSGWSPIASLSASTIPSAPGIQYLSSNDTQIVLGFVQSSNNGGSIITNYQLDLDGVVVSDYSFAADGYSYTALKTTLSLTTGNIYVFRYRAVNANGNSVWSQPLSV